MKLLIYTSIFILLNASNCSMQHDFKELKFGEGGGFTGMVTAYEIKENGDVLKDGKKIKSIDKSELKAIQKKVNNLSTESLKFNHPFNIYYFIETDKGKIVWGDPAFPEPDDIKALYNQLKKSINQ